MAIVCGNGFRFASLIFLCSGVRPEALIMRFMAFCALHWQGTARQSPFSCTSTNSLSLQRGHSAVEFFSVNDMEDWVFGFLRSTVCIRRSSLTFNGSNFLRSFPHLKLFVYALNACKIDNLVVTPFSEDGLYIRKLRYTIGPCTFDGLANNFIFHAIV